MMQTRTHRLNYILVAGLLVCSLFMLALANRTVYAAVDCAVDQEQPAEGEVCNQTLGVPPLPEPVFVDATCGTQGYYMIPDAETRFVVGDSTEPAVPGTYPAASGEIIITEFVDPEFAQESEAEPYTWTHTFTAPICSQVLGDSTDTPSTPQVLAAETLANTGAAITAATIASLGLILAAVFVYRRPVKNS